MHWCYEFLLFWRFWSGRRNCPGFNRTGKRCLIRIFLSLETLFAKSHATLRAHLCWCKVSSCVLSANLGAHGLRSRVSHFGMIPRHGPSLSRILMWCQVPLGNWTVWFDPNILPFLRLDFLGRESRGTQPKCIESSNRATDLFFDFLLGWTSASTCRNRHSSPFVHPDSDLSREVPIISWRVRSLSPWGNAASCSRRTFPSATWTFWWFLSVSLCLRLWCRRERLSFSSLIASVSRR